MILIMVYSINITKYAQINRVSLSRLISCILHEINRGAYKNNREIFKLFALVEFL